MKTFKKILEDAALDSNDLQLLRNGIIEEHKATSLYEQMASQCTNERAKELFLAVAYEEKVHAQEFEKMIEELDPEYIKAGKQADKESKDQG